MSLNSATIMAALDARQWSGVTVLTWDGANVTLPTYSRGNGRFEDPLVFLNARASGTEAFVGDIAAAWTASGAAGTMTMDIDPTTGRVRLTSSLVDFTIGGTGSGNAWWGFASAGHGLVGGAAPFVRVAPSDFSREPTFAGGLVIDPTGAPGSFTVGAARWWQDPITALREREVAADADAGLITAAQCLEGLIVTASGEASVRVGLDAEGRVIFAWRTGIGNPGPPVWVSTTFRDRLGFSGNEAMQSSGLVDYLRADYPCPGVYVAVDGFAEYDLTASTTGTATMLLNGAYGSASYGTRAGARVAFDIRGPATGSMLHTHWIERCVRYLPPGAPVTIYPRSGEVRRRLPDGAYGVTAARVGESLLYTQKPTYAQGYDGRRRGKVSTRSVQQHSTGWQGDSRTWWRVELDMTMSDE